MSAMPSISRDRKMRAALLDEATTRSLLQEYAASVALTDRLPPDKVQPVLMGLFGEVGSLMATSKKRLRDEDAYSEYSDAVCEEFGDVLWYLGAICRRMKIKLEALFLDAGNKDNATRLAVANCTAETRLEASVPIISAKLEHVLIELGQAASGLLAINADNEAARRLLLEFVNRYLRAIDAVGVRFGDVVLFNSHKARDRFIKPNFAEMPVFDSGFDPEEQLPWEFEIEVTQRKSGQSYLRMNGVFVGDPLTDNIADSDGYRFHDVFHFAYAAILHWSPTFRALLKQKRKSNKVVDESQDGGRAIVVEEGLAAYIFSRAKRLEFFASHDRVSYDLLKTVQRFVQGYEVDACPASLWEIAILEGYKVFRQVRDNEGGVVIGNRHDRMIEYRKIGGRG